MGSQCCGPSGWRIIVLSSSSSLCRLVLKPEHQFGVFGAFVIAGFSDFI